MALFRPREIQVDKELAKLRRRIGKRLERNLAATGVPSKTLHAAMRHAALPPGKCLRGGLVYASGRALGIEEKRLDGAAAAMELVHAYSLTHDDLPCMDDDDERRGRPACHRVYGEVARKDSWTVRTFVRKVNSMCFGGDIWAWQLEHSIEGVQSQAYCVERLSLLNVEAVEIFHADA